MYDNPNAYIIVAAIEGALVACDDLGLGLQIHPFNSRALAAADELCNFASSSRLAGLVLTQPLSERPAVRCALETQGTPFVSIVSSVDDSCSGLPYVHVNDRDAAHSVASHLIQLGHHRIGFLRGGRHHRASGERFAGYKNALADYGITLEDCLVIDGDYTFNDGFRGAMRLLSSPHPPTAIFGCNDEVAAGALAAAHSNGLRVPYSLSIAGFEDSPFSRYSWPALTTARQHSECIVERATRLLITYICDGTVAVASYKPELVVRGSTAPPA